MFVLIAISSRAVTGEHAFVAPDFASGDQRGPCPGLNALANHGYIPHDGVVSVSIFMILFLLHLLKNTASRGGSRYERRYVYLRSHLQ